MQVGHDGGGAVALTNVLQAVANRKILRCTVRARLAFVFYCLRELVSVNHGIVFIFI